MQRLTYIVEIDEEFEGFDFLHELLNDIIREELGCNITRSKFETPDEIIFDGEWEDEDKPYCFGYYNDSKKCIAECDIWQECMKETTKND